MIHEITQILWLQTPKGLALAKFMLDYGPESNIFWICAQQDTGECWTWSNQDVRIAKNITLGRESMSPFCDPDKVRLIGDTDNIAVVHLNTICDECRAYNCGCTNASRLNE